MQKSSPLPKGFTKEDFAKNLQGMRSPFIDQPNVVPIAVCASDIHLRHTPSAWRSNEPDWYVTMSKTLDEVYMLIEFLKVNQFLIAGDIFHKWDVPPRLINFAIKKLPHCTILAIPGQHDLPNHSDNQMECSPYHTLLYSKMTCIDKHGYLVTPKVTYEGYGWNTELTPHTSHKNRIALVHRYMWMEGCSYNNAPATGKVMSIAKQLNNPDLIISGDNHIGFWHEKSRVFNCGAMFRTSRDQKDYKPRVGIVYSNLEVIPYYLDTSEDVTLEDLSEGELTDQLDKKDEVEDFLKELGTMGRGGLDFLEAVKRFTSKRDIRALTAKIINDILTGEKHGNTRRRT